MRLSVEKTRHASGWRKNAREKFGTERADIVIEETTLCMSALRGKLRHTARKT